MKVSIVNMGESFDKIDRFVSWSSKFFVPEKKPKTKKKLVDTCKYFATCDFETTNDKELRQAFVYSWAFCFRGRVLVGRDMNSFMYFIEHLSSALGSLRLFVYWHNLSYDVTFVQGYYHFKPEECFYTQPRKMLYCNLFDNIEFRCSYLLTGLNLHTFTNEMNVKHKKKSGEKFDYTKYRTPYDGLRKDTELWYIINDVRGLLEALEVFYGDDTVFTIPYTKTGFVRRDIKKACYKIPWKVRESWGLSYEAFLASREAFRGGNTHESRFYADNDTITEDCEGNDFCSHYPTQMLLSSHFPARAFTHKGKLTWSEYNWFIERQHMCGIFRITMENARLREPTWACPYIPLAKVRKERKAVLDNGRLLAFEYAEMTVTDIDIMIIKFEYDVDITITDSYLSATAPLPKPIRDVVMKYYEGKTSLKGVEGMEIIYNNEKTKLNACYGNFVMSSVQRLLLYDDKNQEYKYSKEFKGEEYDNQEALERAILENFNKKGLPNYSIGVFVTALARLQLEIVMSILPPYAMIYCDTDSLKYHGVSHHIFDEYNEYCRKQAEEKGLFAFNKKGEKKYLNQFTYEEHYKRFKGLGAKKYSYEDDDGKLHLTCAGVNKKKGAKELEKYNGLESFKNGFVFVEAGGVSATYNDKSNMTIYRKGKPIEIRKNIYLENSTYTLGQDEKYEWVIEIAMRYLHGEIDNEYNEWYNDDTDIR